MYGTYLNFLAMEDPTEILAVLYNDFGNVLATHFAKNTRLTERLTSRLAARLTDMTDDYAGKLEAGCTVDSQGDLAYEW